MNTLDADERDAVRRELEAAERALLRCRRLGSTLIRLRPLSRWPRTRTGAAPPDYTAGARSDADYAGRGLNARV